MRAPERPAAGAARRTERQTVWLTTTDWQRVRAFAAAQSIAPATALHELVLAGLDAKAEPSHGPLLEVDESLRRIGMLLDRIGPAIVGLPHLLAYWATRESDDVSQDDLLAEFATNARAVWQDEVTARNGDRPPRETA